MSAAEPIYYAYDQGRPSLQAGHADCVGPQLAEGASTEAALHTTHLGQRDAVIVIIALL